MNSSIQNELQQNTHLFRNVGFRILMTIGDQARENQANVCKIHLFVLWYIRIFFTVLDITV